MAVSGTRKNLIRIIAIVGIGVIGFMVAMKIWIASTVFLGDAEPAPTPVAAVPMPVEPLDAREQIARNMVSPAIPGTPVMPEADLTLDPSDYSRDLARFIPIERGMDRYAAKDALLLYYIAEPEGEGAQRPKVSSTERIVDGATLFVIRRSGLADDSIAAEETYALFDANRLVEYGSRQQCRRGDTPNQWTTELCP